MKKKNVLMMALSLALVAVIAVGGTLAYLTSTTDVVTNTFYGSAGIAMTLDEANVVVNPEQAGQYIAASGRDTSNTYDQILPGLQQAKDPTIHVSTVPVGGADVYVMIDGVDGNLGYTAKVTVEAGWDKVGEFETVDGLYKYTGGVDPEDLLEDGEPAAKDILVFDGVTFDYDAASSPEIEEIRVVAYAIQKGVSDADTKAGTALNAAIAEANEG